jgi:amino acid transporter/nucleotide-binding universal stress UspA family protein
MSTPHIPHEGVQRGRLRQASQVIVVSSVMFAFISYWRTAAIVLSDLGSTAYYIGGIVEQAVGPAAPWFILAVMLFSYAVRSVYIESVSLFVRGGVYRVTREALGGLAAKISVSALLFDYVLTGPISSVSAGQYIMGLLSEISGSDFSPTIRSGGAVLIASFVTIYFYRQNLLGIHESSGKALKIMVATTVMAVVILSWCLITLAIQGPHNAVPMAPDLTPKMNYALGEKISPLGFLEGTALGNTLESLHGREFLGLLGVLGVLVAFGHSILAMSGEETLAQVYREVQSPKLKNFKRAAFIVFLYSLIFTAGMSFLAVLLIPDEVRMSHYADNLIGGLAMSVAGPVWARLLLNGFVVIVGFLILSGAVNTAIIGSNGVLNRVADDGVVPAWLQKPHARYGTTYRMLGLIVALQLITILASRGDVIVLGEAYAFGVVWSFVFMTASMLVLRFKNPQPREFSVPLNIRVGRFEIPIGLSFVFLVLFFSAIANLLTKETATKWGLGFTSAFLLVFTISERINLRRRRGEQHEHLEQFNREFTASVSPADLGLSKHYRKLVAIRSPGSMYMLEKALAETDPETTDLVVMTANLAQTDETQVLHGPELTSYEQQLMTAVVQRAELAGKQVKPLIVPTNNPLYAVLRTASELQAQEVIIGASNKYTAEDQMDQVALYWLSIHGGTPAPVTVRVVSRNRDLYFDLGGGNRIPKISERRAHTVAELRAAGVGADRALFVHDGSVTGHDLFQAILTTLDPQVPLTLAHFAPGRDSAAADHDAMISEDQQRAQQLKRDVQLLILEGDPGPSIVNAAAHGDYDLIILALSRETSSIAEGVLPDWADYVISNASGYVFLAVPPPIPALTDGQ